MREEKIKINFCKGESLGGSCCFGKKGNSCSKDCEYEPIPPQSPSLVSEEEIEYMGEKWASEVYENTSDRSSVIYEAIEWANRKSNFISGFKKCLSLVKEGEKDEEDWISVSEKLPTKEDANSEGKVLASSTLCTQIVDWDFQYLKIGFLEHWKKLPNPPKQEQQKTGNNEK